MTVVGALTCGLTLATAIGHLETSIGQPALSVALLVLATAASYTGTPDGFDATRTSGWQLVITRLRRLQEDRRRHRELRPPRAGGAIAGATVPHLYQEPAAPVPQLFATERSALLFWRYRVAIGEAAQRGFELHLADHSLRQSPGVWRPISDWSCGAPPVVPGAKQEVTSVAGEQSDMAAQVTRVTRAA